jgi:hypothetical protein
MWGRKPGGGESQCLQHHGGMPERIKIAANKRDVPYQSLIKTWLAEKLDMTRK